jgi:putative transposase
LVKKRQTRLRGLDTRIVNLYAKGMSTREIPTHLEEMYGVEASPGLISNVTDAVMDEIKTWQSRSLEAIYPIVYLDRLHLKIRDKGVVKTKAVYVAIGVNLEGVKDVLGLWVAQTEGAKFWLSILTELKNRGVQDVLIACVDGLKGFPEAIETVFPKAQVQLCIVHLVRYSLNFVSWKEQSVVSDLKAIYKVPTEQAAEADLEAFAAKWDAKYASISQSWCRNWSRVIPCFSYPAAIRRAVYTTNAVEIVESQSTKRPVRPIPRNRNRIPDLHPFLLNHHLIDQQLDQHAPALKIRRLEPIIDHRPKPIDRIGQLREFPSSFNARFKLPLLNQHLLAPARQIRPCPLELEAFEHVCQVRPE